MKTDQIQLLSFDIDDTLIDLKTLRGSFAEAWIRFGASTDTLLTYNTGRLYPDVINLVEKNILPKPSYIIGGVGTHIYNCSEEREMGEFEDSLKEGWDLGQVESRMAQFSSSTRIQPEEFQHPYKRSYFFEDAEEHQIGEIKEYLGQSDLQVEVIYSGNRYLDIIPSNANKGNALLWLINHLKIPISQTLVAGDSGNDAAMFELEGVFGILVSNALPELKQKLSLQRIFQATKEREKGVIQGLVYFEVIGTEALGGF